MKDSTTIGIMEIRSHYSLTSARFLFYLRISVFVLRLCFSACRNMASPLTWAMLWPLTTRVFTQYTASCTKPGRVCGAFQ